MRFFCTGFFCTTFSNQLRNQSSKLLFLETITLCLRWFTHFGIKLMQERVLSLHHCADGSNHLPVDDKSSHGMPWVSSPQASRPCSVTPQFAIKKIVPVECEAIHKAADAQFDTIGSKPWILPLRHCPHHGNTNYVCLIWKAFMRGRKKKN